MSVALYMDVHVPRPVTKALRQRGGDVLTAQEDGTAEFEDADLLDRARELERVLVSQDVDLLVEANRRQRTGDSFPGVFYAPQLGISLADFVEDLELLAKAGDRQDSKTGSTIFPSIKSEDHDQSAALLPERDFSLVSLPLPIRGCRAGQLHYVAGMDWQQSVALVIVGATALAFLASKFTRRKFDFARDTHCGCGSGSGGRGQSIVLHARKGERREIHVKMR